MKLNRLKWKTIDDTESAKEEDDEPITDIQFHQQRIRTFFVAYRINKSFLN